MKVAPRDAIGPVAAEALDANQRVEALRTIIQEALALLANQQTQRATALLENALATPRTHAEHCEAFRQQLHAPILPAEQRAERYGPYGTAEALHAAQDAATLSILGGL
jgi:hypothetical protein